MLGEDRRDAFAKAYSIVHQLWEALRPAPFLAEYKRDYTWLTAVYQFTRPAETSNRLLWHALGGKTLALIHEHVQVDLSHRDLETIILDDDLVEDLMLGGCGSVDPEELAKIVSKRIAKHAGDPLFLVWGSGCRICASATSMHSSTVWISCVSCSSWGETPCRQRRKLATIHARSAARQRLRSCLRLCGASPSQSS